MIVFLISTILERGVYSVKFINECDITPEIARQMIRDVITNTNVDDFAYVENNLFVMIVDVLARQRGYVEKEQVESILKNYCPHFSIDFKETLP